MKNHLHYIIEGILSVAVIVLFILHFCDKPQQKETDEDEVLASQSQTVAKGTPCAQSVLPIAYVNVDTLLEKYNFAKQSNERLLSNSERSKAELQKKMVQWQKEAADFQRKLQNNAFMSRDKAEQENNRLLKKRQELVSLDKKLTQNLLAEQKKMNAQLRDTIDVVLKQYNKHHKYQMIFSNTLKDNVLYAPLAYNITNDVIKLLNKRCPK